eukprot:TRINITY_DN639_c0_g3_i1.p1 TRINITY_DN639_c0_g3~~TRINITY_DN639_c0_g3_i1.p1  ORF type:complete len:572 (-),score=88.70 TRINITY_DN639_c0_g3_i1:620-2335(-)
MAGNSRDSSSPSPLHTHTSFSSSRTSRTACILATLCLFFATFFPSCVDGFKEHLHSHNGAIPRRHMTQQSNHAFVTLLYGDSFLLGVRVLGQSLRDTGTLKDMVVLVSPDVSQQSIAVLQADGWLVEAVDLLKNPNSNYRETFWGVYTKLHVFNMTQYERVVYLDADTLVVNSIEDLFLTHGFCANIRHSEKFNAGVLVLEPSSQMFASMLTKVESLPSYDGGDQGFLNEYFHGIVNARLFDSRDLDRSFPATNPPMQRLQTVYNADLGLHVLANRWMFDASLLRVVHYTLGPLKPWDWWTAWLLPPTAQWQAFRVALPESLPGVGQGGTTAEKRYVQFLAWLPLIILFLLHRQGQLLQFPPPISTAASSDPTKTAPARRTSGGAGNGIPKLVEILSILACFAILLASVFIAAVRLVPKQIRPWTGLLLSYEWTFTLFLTLFSQYLIFLGRVGRWQAKTFGGMNGSGPSGALDAKYFSALKGMSGSFSGVPPVDFETATCLAIMLAAAVLLPSAPYVLGVKAVFGRLGLFFAAGCTFACLATLLAQQVAQRWYLRGCHDWMQAMAQGGGAV